MSISDDDAKIRQNWAEGHKVSIFSNSRKKWFDGSVAQIFHDDEGEWLEIRYDKSMSKQVQRYSTDIKPTAQQKKEFQMRKQQETKKKKQKPSTTDVPFPEQEMNLRKSWSKSDDVEIFSNTHQEWYRGEIVEIIKDDEGEWLNVVWARNNGEAMSKQVQRFSTDVRPAQDDSDSSDPGGTDSLTDKYRREIMARQNGNFVRDAPPFSRTIQTSTFSFPATNPMRQKKKLQDVEEKDEVSTKKGSNVADWVEAKVLSFVQGLGRAYLPYKTKFRGMKGIDLLQINDKQLIAMGLKKLHRLKLQIEMAKLSDADHHQIFDDAENISVLNWDAKRIRKWAAKQPVLSQYATNFQRNGVDGMLLFELDDEDMETIGIRPSHRTKVFDTIEELHRFSFPNAPPLSQNRTPNAASDEKEEEITVTSSTKTGTTKRRQSVVQIEPMRMSNDFEKDELLTEMASLLLKLGNTMSGIPGIKEGVEAVQSKLDAYLAKQKSPKYLGNNNLLNNENEFDVSVDTNFEEEDETPSPDVANLNGGGSLQKSKLKDRTMENLDSAESPAGMDYARNFLATVGAKKGHRRRQSLPYINSNPAMPLEETEESDDDSDDISDIQ